MKKESHILSIVLLLAGMLLVISASIAVPLIVRPLYYWQIDLLGLTKVRVALADGARTLTRAEVITAYNEMMDYCMGVTNTFSTGILAFTPEGASHFADVRFLFLLDLTVLGITGTIVLAFAVFRKLISVKPARWLGLNTGFWCGLIPLVVFAVIGILGAIDFDRFFTIFHHVFFPGKSNWIFDPRYDQVINILPEKVFSNFALVIVLLILISCAVLIIQGAVRKKKAKQVEAAMREEALKKEEDGEPEETGDPE